MAVSVTNQSTPLGNQIVEDTAATNSAQDNVIGGSGTLYAVEIVNPNVSAVYFKLANSATATAGTTAADMVLMCPGSVTRSFILPAGVLFNVGFSHWCVTGAAESDTTPPGSDVTARYVTG